MLRQKMRKSPQYPGIPKSRTGTGKCPAKRKKRHMERKYLPLREVQMVEYGILCRTVDYLEKNGLSYILAGGTMLGAVRHGGFIPWDDDIDILVPRDDFEKLRQLIGKTPDAVDGVAFELPGAEKVFYPFIKAVDPRYVCVDERIINDHPVHVWIDIFPLDHFPDDPAEHRKWVRRMVVLKRVLYSGILTRAYWDDRCKGDVKTRLEYIIGRCLYALMGRYTGVSRKMDETAKKMNRTFRNSNHVGDGAWPEGMKDYFTVEMTEPPVMHAFEDREFRIPANYDMYLKSFYGEYMTPPPEGQRAGHHIQVYRVEE